MIKKKIIAIIPARGGSKGIPGKNLVSIGGLPLLAHSILHAKASGLISRVYISTDDPQIAEVTRYYGAEVIYRPPSLSGDTASSESALLHALDFLLDQESYEPDLVVFLQATSPIRKIDDIDNALNLTEEQGFDSLFSACSVEGFTWKIKSGNLSPENYDPSNRPRRQDVREHIIEENGSIYIFKPAILRQFNCRLGGNIGYYLMDRLSSYQVDSPEDISTLQAIIKIFDIRPGGQND